MTGSLIQKQLLFTNEQEMIQPFLWEVGDFIHEHLPAQSALDFKAKVIIVELLTNSIKHSGDAPTQVELLVNKNEFQIRKIDYGTPFDLNAEGLTWPIQQIPAQPVKIYADHLNGLFADVSSANSLSFYAEFYESDDEAGLATMSEHYGLMIICRASDAFVYEYEPATSKNTFTVTIQLN